MKATTFAIASLLVGALLAGCATTQQNTAVNGNGRPRLQVTVNVPPSMSMMWDEEIAEAFGYRVASTMHEQGFRGGIRYIDRWETPMPGVPMLAIDLIEWRVDRMGMVDCAFNATLNTPSGSQRLGVFTGTSFMMWPRRDWYARAQGFEEAARDAATNLVSRLEATGLVDVPR